jgi:MFS family permease
MASLSLDGMRTVPADNSRDKWVALSVVTLGTLMVFINQSIVLISLPDIFQGIKLNPLTPGNTGYMLWMLMGFMVVLAVLVVTLGRVGDMFGRVRIFNLGFAVFTLFSILLAVTWFNGPAAAMWLIGMRVGQGVGGACSSPTRRPSSPTPSRSTSAVSVWASTTWPPSRARSSAWSWAACWPRCSGTWSS